MGSKKSNYGDGSCSPMLEAPFLLGSLSYKKG